MASLPDAPAPTTCIFCDGGPLTEEHLWAKWIQQYFPKTTEGHHHLAFRDGAPLPVSERIYHGDILTATISCVCARCNNEWMSALQRRSKRFLLPLLQGHWQSLSKRSAKLLASWVTMFTMVYEFQDPPTAAIPIHHRDRFRRIRDPLSDWYIRIATIDAPAWRGRAFHTGIALGDSSRNEASVPANVQITTAVMGQLLIHSIYLQPGLFPINLAPYDQQFGLTPLWPELNVPTNAPARVLVERDADEVAFYLRNLIVNKFSKN